MELHTPDDAERVLISSLATEVHLLREMLRELKVLLPVMRDAGMKESLVRLESLVGRLQENETALRGNMTDNPRPFAELIHQAMASVLAGHPSFSEKAEHPRHKPRPPQPQREGEAPPAAEASKADVIEAQSFLIMRRSPEQH